MDRIPEPPPPSAAHRLPRLTELLQHFGGTYHIERSSKLMIGATWGCSGIARFAAEEGEVELPLILIRTTHGTYLHVGGLAHQPSGPGVEPGL